MVGNTYHCNCCTVSTDDNPCHFETFLVGPVWPDHILSKPVNVIPGGSSPSEAAISIASRLVTAGFLKCFHRQPLSGG